MITVVYFQELLKSFHKEDLEMSERCWIVPLQEEIVLMKKVGACYKFRF